MTQIGRNFFVTQIVRTVTLALIAVLPTPAISQTTPPPDQSADEARRQESLREQEIRNRERQEIEQKRILKQEKGVLTSSSESDVQFQINKISVSGADSVDPADIKAITSRYVGTKLGIAELRNLRKEIGDLYSKKGYDLIQILIGKDGFETGEINILIAEGKLEELRICKNNKQRRSGKSAFRVPLGGLFKVRPYEQGIEILDGLFSFEQIKETETVTEKKTVELKSSDASTNQKSEFLRENPLEKSGNTKGNGEQFVSCSANEAKIFIIPGSKVGFSVVEVNSFQKRPFWVSLGSDNLGASSTGKVRYNAGLGIEDVLGLYERFVIRGSHTSKFDKGDDRARNVSADFTLPFGYWNFHVGGSYYDYRTTVQTANQPFLSSGDQTAVSADVERVLRRGQSDVVTLGVGIELRDTTNSVNGLRLASSSRKLTVLNAHLERRGTLFGGSIFSDISISQGIRAFDALRDRRLTKAQPHAQFTTVSLSLDFQRGFVVGEKVDALARRRPPDFVFRSSLAASWAPHALFGSEKVQIGGPFTVRGFDDNNLSGDIGGYVRNEFSFFPRVNPQSNLRNFGRPSLFVGLDGGVITKDYADPSQENSLFGVAGGIRLSSRNLTAEARIETPISRPSQLRGEKGIFRFSTSLRF